MKNKFYFVKLLGSIFVFYVALNIAFVPEVNGKVELNLPVSLILLLPSIIIGFIGLAIISNPVKLNQTVEEEKIK